MKKVNVARLVEDDVFRAIHHVVEPRVMDRVLVGYGGATLGINISEGITLSDPNWSGVLIVYGESLGRGIRSARARFEIGLR